MTTLETQKQKHAKRWQSLDCERQSWLTHWKELARFIHPRAPRFCVHTGYEGQKRHHDIYDSTATLCVRTLASGMMSGVTSPARPWFKLTTSNPEASNRREVKNWLSGIERTMREVLAKSNIYNVLHSVYSDLAVFGTAVLMIEADAENVIHAYRFPIGSYALAASHRLVVDTLYREFSMTARQMVERFGIDRVSDPVKTAYRNGQLDTVFSVIQAIEPNPEYDSRKRTNRHFKFKSVMFEPSTHHETLLSESGYEEQPFFAPRWETTGEDVYGGSPGMDVLGDVKSLQIKSKRLLTMLDKMTDPPMMAPSSLRRHKVSLLPGDVTYIDVMQGQQGLTPLYQIDPAAVMALTQSIELEKTRVRRAFYEDIFLMFAGDDRTGRTATEIAERHAEKMLVLGPVLERLSSEMLDPMINRVFWIMARQGLIPPPPNGFNLEQMQVEYISILAQAQKFTDTASIQQFMAFAGSMANVNPEILDKIDFDHALETFIDRLGSPPELLRPQKEVEQIRQLRLRQTTAQQAILSMQQMADGAKKLSDTNLDANNGLTKALELMGLKF